MASRILMPKLSDTMQEGVIVKWLKKEGDRVEPGDVLAEVETDKANMELELFEEGVIRKLFGAEGQGIPIGGTVGILADDEDEDISAMIAEAGASGGKKAGNGGAAPRAPAQAPAGAEPVGSESPVLPATPRTDGRLRASPVARKLAEGRGLDLRTIRGTGPGGRIIKRDVEAHREAAPAPGASPAPGLPAVLGPEVVEVPPTTMRSIIAKRMVESKFSAPHFYVTMDVGMERAIALREELKALEVKVSYNDIVLKAVAYALTKVPAMNANYDGTRLLRFRDAHVGFAVAWDGNLITPVVRQANLKSLGQIAAETRELITRAKAKKLKPDEYTGGTFTVSNLGMFGVSDFTAIINRPEVGIMAVGGIRAEPVVRGGQVVPGHRMKVTVSTDHRGADGADAAQLLVEFQRVLENPSLLLV